MRNFLLGKSVNVADTAIDKLAAGAVGIYDYSTGVPKALTYASTVTGTVKTKGCIALGRASADGGPVVIPIYGKNFSYVKAEYSAHKTFTQKITVVSQDEVGDYTVIVAKKGVGFNERNKWTATIHVYDSDETVDSIAAKLAKAINDNSESSGVKATVASNVITVTAVEAGVDYKLVLADLATNSTLSALTSGTKGQLDAKYVQDLAMKAAADCGFNDTYEEGVKMYPTYPLDPSKVVTSGTDSFVLFTIKFSEPREVGTTDEPINQIIQVVFPSTATVTGFEEMLKVVG